MEGCIIREQLALPRQWEGKLVYILHGVLTNKECMDLIKRTEIRGFEPVLFNNENKCYDDRDGFGNCSRCVVDSAEDANKIWRRIKRFIPEMWNTEKVVGLNERIRVLRYDCGENFHPHLAGSNVRENGVRSQMSVQVYLNEEFVGGNTTFLCMLEKEKTEVKPKTGSVLIFEHNILHEESKILSGRKYVLRTDVMYSDEIVPKKSKLSRLFNLFRR